MKNFLGYLIIILTITSCGPYWYKPYGKIFKHAPKDGTPGYQTGWMHGCESGLATQFGSAFMMTFYKWKKDPDLSSSKPNLKIIKSRYQKEWDINWEDPDEIQRNIRHYKKIFWIAHIFCRHSIVGTYQTAKDSQGKSFDPPLPGKQRYVPQQHSLGNIYSFHGRGSMHPELW